mmetsp:Transcript_42494/g.91274  ORF Transcript_42494/g.91274 Transcript_42494/m.91274 type:complete len:317 (+) Transcript_42494:1184-2134(+)
MCRGTAECVEHDFEADDGTWCSPLYRLDRLPQEALHRTPGSLAEPTHQQYWGHFSDILCRSFSFFSWTCCLLQTSQRAGLLDDQRSIYSMQPRRRTSVAGGGECGDNRDCRSPIPGDDYLCDSTIPEPGGFFHCVAPPFDDISLPFFSVQTRFVLLWMPHVSTWCPRLLGSCGLQGLSVIAIASYGGHPSRFWIFSTAQTTLAELSTKRDRQHHKHLVDPPHRVCIDDYRLRRCRTASWDCGCCDIHWVIFGDSRRHLLPSGEVFPAKPFFFLIHLPPQGGSSCASPLFTDLDRQPLSWCHLLPRFRQPHEPPGSF